MIVKMSKCYVASRSTAGEELTDALGELGVVHLTAVDNERAVADDKTLGEIDTLRRALQILDSIEPDGDQPDISATGAAVEVLTIQRASAERLSRLAALHRQIEHLAVWGDVRLQQFEFLRDAGVDVQFFSVPREVASQMDAECFSVVGELPGKRVLVAVIDRSGAFEQPQEAQPVALPARDRPSIRAEAAQIDSALKQDTARLAQLAHLPDEMARLLETLHRQADHTVAVRGALADEHLFAVGGWAPTDKAETLGEDLAAMNIDAVVQVVEPDQDELPPTLIRYPRWARPIKGLFDILGTLPGYKEADLSGFFMIALPIFAAMLIGDAGYGLLFLAVPLVLYRKMISSAGSARTHLIMIFGAATLIWGVLTGNYFGVTPNVLQAAGGLWTSLGNTLNGAAVLWDADPEKAREILIKMSFIVGGIHLTAAHFRQVVAYFPDRRFLAHIGWSLVLWGMLGLIWQMFFIGLDRPMFPAVPWLLAGGGSLAILFTFPGEKLAKRIGLGFAASLLPLLAMFSDAMSYIRLMAVGLASYYIAVAFNGLGAQIAQSATWFGAAPVILFGHALNIGLAIIAIFAHGVRLNMLEFSSNTGVQWAGYAYKPFATGQTQET